MRMRNFKTLRSKSIVIGALALAVVGGGVAAASAVSAQSPAPATAVVNGVDQAKLHACIASGNQNCSDTVPGLAQCMDKKLVCNEQATQNEGQAIRTITPSGKALTITEATTAALKMSTNYGVGADKASVKRVPWSEFSKNTGESVPTQISAGNALVVKVNAPAMTDGGPGAAPVEVSGYAVVYDETTGQPIETCLGTGCNSLSAAEVLP